MDGIELLLTAATIAENKAQSEGFDLLLEAAETLQRSLQFSSDVAPLMNIVEKCEECHFPEKIEEEEQFDDDIDMSIDYVVAYEEVTCKEYFEIELPTPSNGIETILSDLIVPEEMETGEYSSDSGHFSDRDSSSSPTVKSKSVRSRISSEEFFEMDQEEHSSNEKEISEIENLALEKDDIKVFHDFYCAKVMPSPREIAAEVKNYNPNMKRDIEVKDRSSSAKKRRSKNWESCRRSRAKKKITVRKTLLLLENLEKDAAKLSEVFCEDLYKTRCDDINKAINGYSFDKLLIKYA